MSLISKGDRNKVASVSYSADSLVDVADAFESMVDDENRKALQPKDTVASKRYHAGKRDAFKFAADMLRVTTLGNDKRLLVRALPLLREWQAALGQGDRPDLDRTISDIKKELRP